MGSEIGIANHLDHTATTSSSPTSVREYNNYYNSTFFTEYDSMLDRTYFRRKLLKMFICLSTEHLIRD
jgi:hypothetical protein